MNQYFAFKFSPKMSTRMFGESKVRVIVIAPTLEEATEVAKEVGGSKNFTLYIAPDALTIAYNQLIQLKNIHTGYVLKTSEDLDDNDYIQPVNFRERKLRKLGIIDPEEDIS